jgi:ABC-2 type transport system ATP-binding protein
MTMVRGMEHLHQVVDDCDATPVAAGDQRRTTTGAFRNSPQIAVVSRAVLSDQSAIAVTGLTVIRGGRPVLADLSLAVRTGSVTGLLGPSGCGKTTLMRAIVGVQIVAGGSVEVLGRPAGAPELRPRVGYVTQAPSVYADLSVEENLRYFGAILGVGPERVDELLETVELAPVRRRVVGALSGGQRSRVSLASALLNNPELLVLDEPTVGLDPVLRADLWRMFHELARAGTTLLISSHVMDEARECDELLLMRDGTILRQTTPRALRDETGEQDLGLAFLAVIKGGAA